MVKVKVKVELSLSTQRRHMVGADIESCSLLNSALDGGEWPVSHFDRFAPGRTSVTFEYEAGWVSEPFWTFWKKEKPINTFLEFELWIVQPLA